jgi:hypothetical protein
MDLLSGDSRGQIWIFQNSGSEQEPVLAQGTHLQIEGKTLMRGSHPFANSYSKIHLADWNLDGLADLLIGYSEGCFYLFLNKGSKAKPDFGAPKKILPEGGTFPSRPSPTLVDWDGDGKRDLLVGCSEGKVYFYPNIGKNKAPRFKEGQPLEAGGKPLHKGYRTAISVCDWNNDGVKDLVVGNFYSRVDPKQPRGRISGGNVWLFRGRKPER